MLKFAKIRDVKSPHRAGAKEAGIDFYVPNDFEELTLFPNEAILIPMGVKVKLPEVPEALKDMHEYMLEFKNKSGVASKSGLITGACVIDSSYQGELFLNLHCVSDWASKPDGEVSYEAKISPGMKIVQGVLILVNTCEVKEVKESGLYTEESARGDKGFGSNFKE